jgi:type III secretion system FlhB-like substrate exporter
MDNYLIVIFSGIALLIAVIIIALRSHYQKVIKAKDHGIVHHIHEQDRLVKELEHINVEKKVMEKMLKSKFDAVVFLNSPGSLPAEGTKGRKHEGRIKN